MNLIARRAVFLFAVRLVRAIIRQITTEVQFTMIKSGLYAIDEVRIRGKAGRGGYGLSITVDGEVAQSFLKQTRNEESSEIINLRARFRSKNGGKNEPHYGIDFLDESAMLSCIRIGPNCACFHLDHTTMSNLLSGSTRNVKFFSHNIDFESDGAKIISIFLEWFNTFLDQDQFKQPYAT